MKTLKLLPVLLLTACASEPTMWVLNSQDRVAPTPYVTPLSAAMQCAKESKSYSGDIRIGIGVITAEDGVFDYEGQGNYTPASAHHMFITALKASGFRVMNRLGEVTKIIEWENARSMDKLLGDGYSTFMPYEVEVGHDKMGPITEERKREIKYRVLTHGQLLGSTHIISGSITRLDFDTSSGGFELAINGTGIGRRTYRMLVGMDMHITSTISGEVEWAKAYDKQYFGVETKAGSFRLMDSNLVDLNMGVETNEPIQTGIHYLIDYIAYDLARDMRGIGDECDVALPVPIEY